MDKNYKVIVAHPGKQHSFQTAAGLKEAGMLYKYITTVYSKPGSLTYMVKNFLSGKTKQKAESRTSELLSNDDVLLLNEFKALITIFLSRIPKMHKLYLRWNEWNASNFYKKVMHYAKKHGVDAVIVYDGYSDKHFDLLFDTKIVRIMDVSIANRKYIRKIFDADIRDTGDSSIKAEQIEYWDESLLERDMKGVKSSEYFLAASQFVKNSLVSNGVEDSKIKIVPYGVDITRFTAKKAEKNNPNAPLNLIFVGQPSYRKGMHHLLEAISKFDKDKVQLTICGQYSLESELYKKYHNLENVHFAGFVMNTQLREYYQSADAFILPSLGEGMAMVGLEAMACGLPIMCTEFSGINDLVDNYESGYIFESVSTESIVQGIEWAISNKEKLALMGERARKVAEIHTWDHYRKLVAIQVKSLCESK